MNLNPKIEQEIRSERMEQKSVFITESIKVRNHIKKVKWEKNLAKKQSSKSVRRERRQRCGDFLFLKPFFAFALLGFSEKVEIFYLY